jgi:hypothetical protein
MKVEVSDKKLLLIHSEVFNFITKLDLGLMFSSRLAITNEVINMIIWARDNGQGELAEHLAFQEGRKKDENTPSEHN